jgi:hypothetical protein
MRARRGISAAVTAAALALAACGGGAPDRMSLPQKADTGTWAWCQTLSEAQALDPAAADSPAAAAEQYIITPSSGHQGMGLPIEGTRLEADVQAARAANGSDRTAFLAAVRDVLGDCRYILSRQP